MRNDCERSHQKVFFTWLFYFSREIYNLSFHIPNEGRRSKAEGANLKAVGLKKGVPDVFISWPNSTCHGLYIEFKFCNNKLTFEQAEFLERARSKNYATAVVYSVDEAIKVLKDYLDE